MVALPVIVATWLLATVANASEHIVFPPPFENATLAKHLIKIPYPNAEYYWLGNNKTWDTVRVTDAGNQSFYLWLTNNDTTALPRGIPLAGAGYLAPSQPGVKFTEYYSDYGTCRLLNGSKTYRIVVSEGKFDEKDPKPTQILGYSSLFSVRKEPNLAEKPFPTHTGGAASQGVHGLAVLGLALTVACVL